MQTNLWRELAGLLRAGELLIKGNIVDATSDGGYSIATADGATILARPLPGQTWSAGSGVFVQSGRIVDGAPSLPSIEQFV